MSDDDDGKAARDAFERLVARWQSLACAVAYSALGDRALAEDVAQEAFLVAWRALPRLGDGAAAPAWLCAIVRRVAANVRRKRRWEVTTMDVPEAVAPGPSALDALVTREEERLAARALAALADTYREPLVLFYRGDRSVKEVAAALALSEDAVKQRLSRGRKLLERELPLVARVLRATRPGAAFTAAAVAAFVASRAAPAAAATMPSSGVTAGKLALVAGLALPLLVGVAVVTAAAGKRRAAAAHAPATVAATAHPHASAVAAAVGDARSRTSGAHAADDTRAAVASRSATAPNGWRAAVARHLDLDFGQASSYDMIRLISSATDVPILVSGDIAAQVNLRLTDVTALAALDEILAQAGATRSDSSGLRVVRRASNPASLDGGEPLSLDVVDAALDDVLRAIEPKLGLGIVVAADVPSTTRVTLKVDDVAAGAALAAVLAQADLAVERVAGLAVTPDAP